MQWLKVLVGSAGVILAIFLLAIHIQHGSRHGLPFSDHFSDGDTAGWVAFGGTWQIADEALQNVSDERGAKVLAGSPHWTNYVIDSDVRLDGDTGDAGLLLRVQEPDTGVDAYRGFYTGLRLRDNALVAGDADYGWTERAVQPLATPLHPQDWYHLRAAVQQCRLSVRATTVSGELLAELTITVEDCSQQGQIGLRSYASGGSWRHVHVAYLPSGPSS